MIKNSNNRYSVSIAFTLLIVLLLSTVRVSSGAEGKWIMVGNLHNFYQAHGSEPEEDFGDSQQFGLRWPAFWEMQDIQAARGLWFGAANYYDPLVDYTYPYKVAHVGPRPRPEIEDNEVMPVKDGFKLIANAPHPFVIVDGDLASDLVWNDLIDEVDEGLISDRLIYNQVNTSIGLSMERKIYGFSQQYHDNFFIYDMTFTNNGIVSKDGAKTHNNTLEGVYLYWQFRNAACTEGTVEGTGINWIGQPGWGTERNMRWGKNTMNEVLGENPDSPSTNDVKDDNGNYIRCIYSWHGRHSASAYDNIGSPNYNGWMADGRLGASQYTGVVTIHADASVSDKSNDPYQPSTTWYINSDESATTNNDQFDQLRMQDEYTRLMAGGHPPLSQAEEVGDGYADQWKDGSFSSGIGFGPYTIPPDSSIRIVLAEGVNGLSRKMNTEIGQTWFNNVKLGQDLTMRLPDGSITTDASTYKNTWVYTGVDSILKTFRTAINLFDPVTQEIRSISQPPPPPTTFEVTSQGERIYLTWSAEPESHPYFEGYKLYRAKGQKDSTYYEIFDCNIIDGIVNEYSDFAAERGQSYYYYIVSYDDGSQNDIQPGVPLTSSLFYTRTNKAATLKKPPAKVMDNIRVVPNPYNIRNVNYQYIGEPTKVMFLNLPTLCEIKIFTERGDLVFSDTHEGSGDYAWDLLTSSRQIVVSGVYIVTFYVPDDIRDVDTDEVIIKAGSSAIKKFVVIR